MRRAGRACHICSSDDEVAAIRYRRVIATKFFA
jgi:hypothetical protein